MAHTSFLFIAITAGYFVTLALLMDRIKKPQALTMGLVAYACTVGMIAITTLGHSIAIEAHNVGPHLQIWIDGLSWMACGLSALLLLLSFLPPIHIGDKEF